MPKGQNKIYELYQASVGNTESISFFRVEPANNSEDTMLVYEPAAKYLPDWIENNLMEGMDAETFYGMKYAQERDKDQ